MPEKITISIADDQELFRKAVVNLIDLDKNLTIIDEASNGQELLDKISITLPDLIILKYKMPIMSGREALIKIKKKYPDAKVLIMTENDENGPIIDLISLGVNGFISKSDKMETFFLAINATVNKGSYFDSKISETLINNIKNQNQINNSIAKQTLSEREISVIKEICNGSSNKIISEKLFISPSTVDFHKGNIYKKTETKNAVGLLMFAIKTGLILIDYDKAKK